MDIQQEVADSHDDVHVWRASHQAGDDADDRLTNGNRVCRVAILNSLLMHKLNIVQ